MAGFSIEKGDLCATVPGYTGTNANLIACYQLLGPSILRIGGNTVDFGIWDPTDADEVPNYGVLPATVDALAAFLKATGWKAIYGMDMARSTPALAAAEAAYAAKSLGSSLLAFEIGNEPEMYGGLPGFPNPFTNTEFNADWVQFADAIRASVPGTPLSGAAVPGDEPLLLGWTIPFADAEGSLISVLTEHHYDNPSVPSDLLTPNPTLASDVQKLVAAAQANDVSGGFRIAETNTHAGGGVAGVSDTFASTLWSIDYLMIAAMNGCVGLNFHGGSYGTVGGPGFKYTAISVTNGVVDGIHPLYYGLLLVSLAGTGNFVPVTWNGIGTYNIAAYAIRRADGSTALIVNNKETAITLNAEISLGTTATHAVPTSVTSPGGLAATSGVLIGGAEVGIDGSWTPVAATPLTVTAGKFAISVPPLTATLFICS
ncbi:MAG TPA: hypothetical protein VME66_10855 [Candidatus Acidoferrales bacterium]|nr:hypothetical protein [Candidatus Acidoferrales bacterium]